MGFFKTLTILLLFYFTAGTMFLPEGDFSTLADMPKMYANCKLEDPDMNLPEFVTEHLLEINGVLGLDVLEPGDKPHQPVQFHHQFTQISTTPFFVSIEVKPVTAVIYQLTATVSDACNAGYTASVFRPPIA